MKNIVLFLLAAFAFTSCMTIPETTPLTEKVDYEVIESSELTKDDLFNKVNAWLVGAFNNAPYVKHYENRDEGRIMVKANMETVKNGYEFQIDFVLTIDVKDYKYRFYFDKIILQNRNVVDNNLYEIGIVNMEGLEAIRQDLSVIPEDFAAELVSPESDW